MPRDGAVILADVRSAALDRLRALRPARPLQRAKLKKRYGDGFMTLMAVLLERKQQAGSEPLPARLEDRFVTADADYAKGAVVRVWYAISAVS